MWNIVTYQPVGLTSLKVATATSTGGKSLLLPTPFAFKMALLDVILRDQGVETGKTWWPSVRDGQVAVRGPTRITVINTFTKILRPSRGPLDPDPDTGLIHPLSSSIGFREYVQWQGPLQIAFLPGNEKEGDWSRWLTSISYLGKRGGFVQPVDVEVVDRLPKAFVRLRPIGATFSPEGIIQIMDDCSPQVTFEHVDIYDRKPMKVDRDRLLHHVILPYRLVRSSRGFTLYQRLDEPS